MLVTDADGDAVLRALLLGPIALIWIIVTVRMVGLRAFSKMAAFDFAVTVAVGSMLAMAATSESWRAYGQTLLAISSLLAAQYAIAKARLGSEKFRRLISNEPTVLMREGELREDALRDTRVTRGDVFAKLREANALQRGQVRAVILETTGDISVLHGDDPVDDVLLDAIDGKRRG